MSAIVRAGKATYNFFAGDAVILAAVALAFIAAWFLLHVLHAPTALAGLLYVVTITGGLVTSLAREVAGRVRRGWAPSGWSDLGDVDLDTGAPAAGPRGTVAEHEASFPDGNNAVGILGDTGVTTGLPFRSAQDRQNHVSKKAATNSSTNAGTV